MVQINDVAREEEAVDQRDNPARCRDDRVARLTIQVESHVPARDLTVELAAVPEAARHPIVTGKHDVGGPQARRRVRLPGHLVRFRLVSPQLRRIHLV